MQLSPNSFQNFTQGITSLIYILYIANRSRWESFGVVKLNHNLLEKIHSCTVVLYGQSLLHMQGISLEKFCDYWSVHENCETIPLQTICNIRYIYSLCGCLGKSYWWKFHFQNHCCKCMVSTKTIVVLTKNVWCALLNNLIIIPTS